MDEAFRRFDRVLTKGEGYLASDKFEACILGQSPVVTGRVNLGLSGGRFGTNEEIYE